MYDKHKVILSSRVKVKGAASEVTVSTQSRAASNKLSEKPPASDTDKTWPGATCDALLHSYEEVLEQVYKPDGTGYANEQAKQEHQAARSVWQAFALWLIIATAGCDDYDEEARKAHAAELEQLAEEFIAAFKVVAGEDAGTVYMHEMLCHVRKTVEEFGSLAKFSCQGFEAIHQLIKYYTKTSNHSTATTAWTTVKRISVRYDPNVVLNNGSGKKHGGAKKDGVVNSGHRSKEKLELKRSYEDAHLEHHECVKNARARRLSQFAAPQM